VFIAPRCAVCVIQRHATAPDQRTATHGSGAAGAFVYGKEQDMAGGVQDLAAEMRNRLIQLDIDVG
jgi:hypothetical protein